MKMKGNSFLYHLLSDVDVVENDRYICYVYICDSMNR
jgi:hypothetical protein